VYTLGMPKTPQRRGAPTEVGIRDLRNELSAYIMRARAGESIVITDRGKPVAHLVGLGDLPAGLARMIREGLVELPTRPRRSPEEWGKPIPIPGGIQDLLEEWR